MGEEVAQISLVELFRALFRKRGLRRVPGPLGELKKVSGGYMSEDWGEVWPFPVSMKITWEAE